MNEKLPQATPSAAARRSEEAAGVLLIRLTVLALLLGGLARSWADPDLWGHVRFGGDIIHQGITRTDPYSFTSDIPWVNHEWLAEVLMDLAWTVGRGTGLIALKMIVVGVTLGFVIASIRRELEPPASDVLVFVALVGLWSRVFVVRPQLFSVVLFAVLLWIITSVERGKSGSVWLLPLLFVFWVNLHGGWIVGIGVLLLWTAVGFTPWGPHRCREGAGRSLGGASRPRSSIPTASSCGAFWPKPFDRAGRTSATGGRSPRPTPRSSCRG